MKIHDMKIWPEYFRDVKAGRKKAEIRLDDRDYKIGDLLHLMEYLPRKKQFTGKSVMRKVTAITWLGQVIPTTPAEATFLDRWCVLHMEPV